MELKEVRDDVASAINERMKNPFIISFIVSWLIWNWLLVYELFLFPSSFSMWQKVEIVNQYIQQHAGSNLIIFPLVSSIFVSLIYIVFSSVFLAMFNWFNTTLKSQIFEITAKGENIPRKLYDSLNTKYNKLKQEFDRSRLFWDKIEQDNTSYVSQIHTDQIEKARVENENRKLATELKNLGDSFNSMKAHRDDLQLFSEKEFNNFTDNFANKKTWFVYLQNGIGAQSYVQHEAIRFDDNCIVKDVTTGQIKYELRDVMFSRDRQMIHFQLVNNIDTNNVNYIYITHIGHGVYQGFLVPGLNNIPRSVIFTQDREQLNKLNYQIA